MWLLSMISLMSKLLIFSRRQYTSHGSFVLSLDAKDSIMCQQKFNKANEEARNLCIATSWAGFEGWCGGGEIVGDPGSVLVKQELDAIRVLRGDDESNMIPLVQTPDDLWFLVRCGIGVFLAGKCDDDTCVVLLRLRQLVGAWSGGCLNFGPLAPEVDACGTFDQFYDIGTADAWAVSRKTSSGGRPYWWASVKTT